MWLTWHVCNGLLPHEWVNNEFRKEVYSYLPSQSFGPDGQNTRRHPRGPCDENFAVAEKISIFQEQGSQRIAEKYARDCQNFAGNRIYTRRSLGAESPRDSKEERHEVYLKFPWHEIFYLIGKSFQNDEEWRLFCCDSTLGCRVIQDFNLCKLDECDVTTGAKWCKITKNRISLTTFSV